MLLQLAVIVCGTSYRFPLYSCNAKANSFHLKCIQIKHRSWNKSILLPVNLPCKLDLDLQSELRFPGAVGQGSGQPKNSSLNFEEVDCLFSETGLIFANKISRVALRFVLGQCLVAVNEDWSSLLSGQSVFRRQVINLALFYIDTAFIRQWDFQESENATALRENYGQA